MKTDVTDTELLDWVEDRNCYLNHSCSGWFVDWHDDSGDFKSTAFKKTAREAILYAYNGIGDEDE